jgi:hypothetical protein
LLELGRAEVAQFGLSEFARRLQVDASNLSKADVKRKLSRLLAAKFERYFEVGNVGVNQYYKYIIGTWSGSIGRSIAGGL